MKKQILLISVLCFIALSSLGQDIIVKRNGDEIKSKVLEIEIEIIKYKDYDFQNGPTRNIKISDVFMIIYENGEKEKFTTSEIVTNNENRFGLKPGYNINIEMGYEIGVGDLGMDRLKLNIINKYQINPNFSLGFGTGLRYYFDAEAALIPVFADFRANFIDNYISPYLALCIGYSFDATNDFEGVDLFLSINTGVSFKVSDKSAMNVGIGYEMQKMPFYKFL